MEVFTSLCPVISAVIPLEKSPKYSYMMQINTKLKKFLKAILGNLIARWVITLLVGAYPLSLLIDSFLVNVWPSLQKILNIKIKIPHQEYDILEILIPALLILFLLFIIAAIIRFFKNKFDKPFYFIKEGDIKWKIYKYDGDVKYYPFCTKHGIELEEKTGSRYTTPYSLYCIQGHHITNYSKNEIDELRNKTKKIAQATVNGHYKKPLI
jgi:hypothetical protein